MSLGGSPASTLPASSSTAPSTQPPETLPIQRPSSLMAIFAPGGRGADPLTLVTVAIATRWPPALHSSIALSTSRMTHAPWPAPLAPHDCWRPARWDGRSTFDDQGYSRALEGNRQCPRSAARACRGGVDKRFLCRDTGVTLHSCLESESANGIGCSGASRFGCRASHPGERGRLPSPPRRWPFAAHHLHGQRGPAGGRRRAAPAPRLLPPRDARPDRHERRL